MNLQPICRSRGAVTVPSQPHEDEPGWPSLPRCASRSSSTRGQEGRGPPNPPSCRVLSDQHPGQQEARRLDRVPHSPVTTNHGAGQQETSPAGLVLRHPTQTFTFPCHRRQGNVTICKPARERPRKTPVLFWDRAWGCAAPACPIGPGEPLNHFLGVCNTTETRAAGHSPGPIYPGGDEEALFQVLRDEKAGQGTRASQRSWRPEGCWCPALRRSAATQLPPRRWLNSELAEHLLQEKSFHHQGQDSLAISSPSVS